MADDFTLDAFLADHRPTRHEFAPEPLLASDVPVRPRVGAVYCRTSTNGQLEDSITTQYAAGNAYLEALGVSEVVKYFDRGRSGTTIGGRPALRAMLRACKAGRVDMVVVATICRLSRRETALHRIVDTFKATEVELHEVASGRVDDVKLAVDGNKAEQGRRLGLARKLDGRLRVMTLGRFPGAPTFGFLHVKAVPGLRVPHPEFRHVVLSMFRNAAAGMEPEAIASTLRCPTPATWIAAERHELSGGWPSWTGPMVLRLLRDPAYKGVQTWGKTTTVRNADTFRRLGFEPVSEDRWQAFMVPHMRIVDPELWAQVQDRLAQRSVGRRVAASPRAMVMLTGVAACACCGETLRGPYNRSEGASAYLCSKTEACRESRATIGVVERALVQSLAMDLRLRRCETVTPGRETLWSEQLRDLGRRLSASLEQELDGLTSNGTDVPLEKRRYESLLRVLRSEADDNVEIDDVLRSADNLARDRGVEPLSDPGRLMFDVVRALVTRVDVGGGAGTTRLRVSLDLGPVATQVGGTDLFPTLDIAVPDSQQDPATREAGRAAANVNLVARVARAGDVSLSQRASDLLGRLGPKTLRPRLEALGWSLADLITACALWVSTGRRIEQQGLPDGRAETFEEARRAVLGSGLRGEIFLIVTDEAVAFEKGHLRLFMGRPGFAHLAPSIERALASAAALCIDNAVAPACGEGVRDAVRDWLERTATSGHASTYGKTDPRLTAALATVRLRGLDALLIDGALNIATLGAEMQDWVVAAGNARAVSAAAVLEDHLKGLRKTDLASIHATSPSRVDHLVVRYRAVGPWGMAQWGSDAGPGHSRLSQTQWSEVQAYVLDGRDAGGLSVECVADMILRRFSTSYDLDRLRLILADANLSLPLHREGLRPSAVQARADHFLRPPFVRDLGARKNVP
ncbi:recombinase family protein [Lichenihabitans sp. Uapishka_5]|uniref:recombinase family protein n=1 Tax=Lichenihabitans sp. Uapishka_5 TaxID=3037302 RepID=UPI0029E7E7E5|nr:recombinase family protein [Lichenihabitans sp. Uapishka_5]MDX7953833.1 recombinase family protein [Lichenihabitans sp. Uapishka_5]